jgi:hypothetical protein
MRFLLRKVEFIPEQPEPGILYVSDRFATAVHLCACGCGLEVVTPIKPARWKLTITGKGPTLSPSIGNWSFPCRSHYLIVDGAVRWAGEMGAARVAAVRRRDARDIDAAMGGGPVAGATPEPPKPAEVPGLPTSVWLKLRRLFKRP